MSTDQQGQNRFGLLALIVAGATIGTDFTGALLLVPGIEETFRADITTTQWVLNIYALVFAMLMVAGGKLGDTFGRVNTLRIGLVIFIASSVICLVSPTMPVLLAGRALQGIGAGLIWPNLIGTAAMIVPEARRGVSIGMILAAVTSGNVIGPLMSGAIMQFADWRLFFGINVALAALAFLMCTLFLSKTRVERPPERVDFLGIATLGLAVLAVLLALDVGSQWGWQSPRLLTLIGAGIVLFILFPFVEMWVKDPMVPPRWLAQRQFCLFLAINGMMMPAVFTGFLYFPQYLQKVLGWSDLNTSFGMVPMMGTLAITSVVTGYVYVRTGPKPILIFGGVIAILGCIGIILIHEAWGYLSLMVPMMLIALGGASKVGPAGTATVSLVPQESAALASGLAFMAHLVIGAIGLAGATAVLNATSLSTLGNKLSADNIQISQTDLTALNAADPTSSRSLQILSQFDAATADKVQTAMREAFEVGLIHAYWLALALVAIGLLLVLVVNGRTEDSKLLDPPEAEQP
ncbi:MAG: MFS transporter [Pseudomonadota bacterium]